MKGSAAEVDCGSVSETADDMRMTNAIQGNRLVLKILNQRSFQVWILIALQQDVEGFDNYFLEPDLRRRKVTGNVNLCITPLTETVFNVVAIIKSAL